MLSQVPLQYEDRQQWPLAIEADIRRAVSLERETVITCSTLKAAYRDQLTSPGRVQLVWLEVPETELLQWLQLRLNHYMQAEMLQSQLAAFEPMTWAEKVIKVDGLYSPVQIVNDVISQAVHRFPALKKSWWQCLLLGKATGQYKALFLYQEQG